ncbi:MAG: T9SS type A sorting domain-containing protein [Cryomorphaceae bacterium]|nr:T9SS type A sorting domain-containing protein [Cryomorphaceae bacterium]
MKNSTFSIIMIFMLGFTDLFAQPQFPFEPATPAFPNNSFPFNTLGNNRRQVLYLASDFNAPAGTISKIYVKSSSQVFPNFSNVLIQVGFTTSTTLTAGPYFSPVDTVYYAAPSTPPRTTITSGGSWVEFTLTNPIFYDGTSNIVMDFSQEGHNPGFAIVNGSLANRTLYGPRNAATAQTQALVAHVGFDLMPLPCASTPSAVALDSVNANDDGFVSWTSQGDKWELEFGPCGFTPGTGQATFIDSNITSPSGFAIPGLTKGSCGCVFVREHCDSIYSPWSDSLEICNPYDIDAQLVEILSPIDGQCGSSNTHVDIVVRNNGITPLANIPISVIISGDITDTLNMTYTGGILPFASDTISISSFNSENGGVISISATLSVSGDQFPDNDTSNISSIGLPSVSPIDFDIIYLGNLQLEFRSNQRLADSTVWDIGGVSLLGDTVNFTFSDPDSVQVCMTVFGNCNNGDTCKLIPTSLLSLQGFAENKIRIYPNPANSWFRVELNEITAEQIKRVELVTLDGRKIQLTPNSKSIHEYTTDNFTSGLYIVQIHLSSGIIVQKKLRVF